MNILYPHNQKFLLRRAHDVLVINTCHALACRGHHVFLLCGFTDHDEKRLLAYYGLLPHPNLHLIQLPILRRQQWPRLSWHGLFNIFCLQKILKLRTGGKIDLVYLSEMKLGHFLLQSKRLLGLPFVYEVHGLHAPDYSRPHPQERVLFRNCDGLITTVDTLHRAMERIYGTLPPVEKVPLATDCPESLAAFRPPRAGEPWRIGYIGQLYPLQGVEVLLRALAQLPTWVIAEIIGGKPDHIAGLERLARDLGIAERVRFEGFVPPADVARCAKNAHLFVVPSLAEEKMPFVAHTKVYEYLAMGRPVVAADLPSIREEIEDGKTGLLFTPGSPQALAQAIGRIIADADQAAIMARRGRERGSTFTLAGRAERLEAFFRKMIATDRKEAIV